MDSKFEAVSAHYDRDKAQLLQLELGQCVRLRDEKDKKWSKIGEIVEIRPDQLYYLIDIDGRLAVRSRTMIKLVYQGQSQVAAEDHVSGEVNVQSDISVPLRLSSGLRETGETYARKTPPPKMPLIICVSSSPCSGCQDRTQTTKTSISPVGASRWSIYRGEVLPLGQLPSLSELSSLPPLSCVAVSGHVHCGEWHTQLLDILRRSRAQPPASAHCSDPGDRPAVASTNHSPIAGAKWLRTTSSALIGVWAEVTQ